MWLYYYELAEIHCDPSVRGSIWFTYFDELETRGLLFPPERQVLQATLLSSHASLSSFVWIWIGNILIRLSQTNKLPPSPSPTFNGIFLRATREAPHLIRQGKDICGVQLPFPYQHILAVLVHGNNLLIALSVGVSLGFNLNNFLKQISNQQVPITPIINITAKLMVGIIMPFLYQAFLQASVMMASPIMSYDFPLSLDTMILQLEEELRTQGKVFAAAPQAPDEKSQALFETKAPLTNRGSPSKGVRV